MKIFLKTFGCRVNQVETQSLLEKFISGGHSITDELQEADTCVVNTCTVTGEADKDAERFIRRISRKNPGLRLVVTGCYATLHPGKVLANAPAAEIVGNEEKKSLASRIADSSDSLLSRSRVPCSAGPSSFSIVTGSRGRSRAFVKVQDGCDLQCAYCVVPLARPHKVSKPLRLVKEEVLGLINAGFGEIVLCGIRLGIYRCPESGAGLAELLEEICALKGNFRIRFSSIGVTEISQRLIDAALKCGDRFCDYFHVPLQSGSDRVLMEMGRLYDTAFYSGKVKLLRKSFPELGLYCDVMAGYPTETEGDFLKTRQFINQTGFSGLHVFRYSKREGTPAAGLGNLDEKIVRARTSRLRELDSCLRRNFARSLVGSNAAVLVEKSGEPAYGIASNFQKVRINSVSGVSGGLVRVKITGEKNGVCLATV